MMMEFGIDDLAKLHKPVGRAKGENGQVTIIGGSSLFHGAPMFALIVASRVVDMIYFASPEKTLGKVMAEMKSRLGSFVWVPWDDVDQYVAKSDASLIGPGFMRFRSEKNPGDGDAAFRFSKEVTEDLVRKFSDKKWVIDGGSLQTMDAGAIPPGSVLTPNRKEFAKLFGGFKDEEFRRKVAEEAKRYKCVIAGKGPEGMIVSDGNEAYVIPAPKVALTMGGTGDVLAGLTVGLLARNSPMLATAAAGFLIQKATDRLADQVGSFFNADDLAWEVGKVWKEVNRKLR